MSDIPDLITPDAEVLKRINTGLGQILRRMHERKLLSTSVTGATVVTNPPHLYTFINAFKANRDVGKDILVDQAGNPVSDDLALLACGFSIAQLERFLVIACARKAYAEFGGETKGKLPAELKPFLVFGWQLPMLSIYVEQMNRYQFGELGHGILYIKSPAQLKALAGASAKDIRKVRDLIGDRYDEMMQKNPVAIRGLANCDERSFEFFVKISGDRLWAFFGGNQQLVVELLAEEKKRLLSLGPHFPDLCVKTYRALEEIPTPMLAPFMRAFANPRIISGYWSQTCCSSARQSAVQMGSPSPHSGPVGCISKSRNR